MTKTTAEKPPKQWLTEPRPLVWPSEIGTPREATGTDNLVAANWLVKQTRAIAWPAWEPEIQSLLQKPRLTGSHGSVNAK